jgi:hypothetical protein
MKVSEFFLSISESIWDLNLSTTRYLKTRMSNQHVTASVIVSFVMTMAIVLTIETASIASGRVWVTDPMRNAPIAASESGKNAYIVWWTNRTGNEEVMFRTSTDGGITFGDKVNLSNSTDADSIDAELAAVGENLVIVTWWEWKNQTDTGMQASTTTMGTPGGGEAEPVARISTDAGQTFGPLLQLASNGTIGGEGVSDD